MENMENESFLTQNEIRNVICDWKIENKSVGNGKRGGMLTINWPLTKCRLALFVGMVYEIDRRIYFLMQDLDEIDRLELSGTISIITAEETVHVLGQFENCTFEEDMGKPVYLKDICGKDFLFPNNTFTLRIHLWKPSVSNEATVKLRACSKPIEEKCIFQWIVKSETDDSGKECFTKYVTEVPRSFKNFFNDELFQMSMTLEFENSSDADYGITMNIETHSLTRGCYAKFEIDAISEAGISKSLLNTHFIVVTEANTIYRCPKTKAFEELRSNKLMYYPKGYLKLHCNVTTTSNLGVVENVCFISDTQSPECGTIQNSSEETLKDCIYTLYRQGEFCDVTLCTEEEKFPCHKTVLCARSPVFKAMFQTDMSEKENGLVSILDVDTRAFGSFLTALYTDTLDGLDWECALKVYGIADRYAVSVIQKKCAEFLLLQLSTSNVCEILEIADTHQDEELKTQAQEFVTKHAKEIIKSSEWSQLMSRNSFLAAQVMQLVFSELV